MKLNKIKMTKYGIAALMLSVMLTPGSAATGFGVVETHAAAYTNGSVTGSSPSLWVNVRTKPSMQGSIIRAVKYGTPLKIYSTTSSGWVYVELPTGQKGYIYSSYVASSKGKIEPDESGQKNVTTTTNAKIFGLNANSSVNVRKKANTTSKIIKKLKNGKRLTILSQEGDWVQVKLKSGKVGYVSSKYVMSDLCHISTGKTGTAAANINVRVKPNQKIITSIPKGTKFTITGIYGQWYLIKTNKLTGYVYAGNVN